MDHSFLKQVFLSFVIGLVGIYTLCFTGQSLYQKKVTYLNFVVSLSCLLLMTYAVPILIHETLGCEYGNDPDVQILHVLVGACVLLYSHLSFSSLRQFQ